MDRPAGYVYSLYQRGRLVAVRYSPGPRQARHFVDAEGLETAAPIRRKPESCK